MSAWGQNENPCFWGICQLPPAADIALVLARQPCPISRHSVGLPVHCEDGHRPPDCDTPFWVGCGAYPRTGEAHADQSIEKARGHHVHRRRGGSMAASGSCSAGESDAYWCRVGE